MDLTVRPYRRDDRDPVWRVHDRALRASALDYDPEYNRSLRHVEREFEEVGGAFLVGTVDEGDGERRLVAIGGYQPLDALGEDDHPPAFDGAIERTVRIRSVAVAPSYQGRGVGSRLVGRLEADASEAGFGTFVLSSVAEMSGARAFWRARGYDRLRDDPAAGGEAVWFRADR